MSGSETSGARVAVVGAGLTGASWAGLFAAHGMQVRLTDRDPSVLEHGLARARASAQFLVAEGLAEPSLAQAGLAELRSVDSVTRAVPGCDLVQEAVREEVAAKRAVFSEAAEASPDCLIATSSSGLSITALQQGVRRPERCLAAHPYNPPHLVPLVELAPGGQTAPETLTRAAEFYRRAGKVPVAVRRDVPGYIGNRLSAALWREAIELVRQGVATVEDIDRAMRCGPGLRWAVMGPHLVYDLGGGDTGMAGHLAHLAGIKEGILRDLATWTSFPPDTGAVLEAGLATEKQSPPYDVAATREELASLRDRALAAVVRGLREAGTL